MLLSCFVAGGLFLAAAQRGGRLPGRDVWRVYGVEVATVGVVVAAALLGATALTVLAVALAIPSMREVHGALRARGLPAFVLAAVVLYPALGFAHLPLLGASAGGGAVIYAFALAELNDVAAYLVGAAFGGRRIFGDLSPNKTLAGSVAGALATLGASLGFGFLVPQLGVTQLLGAGLLVAGLGPAGDLIASAMKRRGGVKDFGNAIPTQGGVFDVYDSFALVAPGLHYYIAALGG